MSTHYFPGRSRKSERIKKVTDELGWKAVGVLVPPHFKDMRELLTGGLCWIELLGAII